MADNHWRRWPESQSPETEEELPPELRMLVAGAVGHQRDRINLSLALPTLGIAALRELDGVRSELDRVDLRSKLKKRNHQHL